MDGEASLDRCATGSFVSSTDSSFRSVPDVQELNHEASPSDITIDMSFATVDTPVTEVSLSGTGDACSAAGEKYGRRASSQKLSISVSATQHAMAYVSGSQNCGLRRFPLLMRERSLARSCRHDPVSPLAQWMVDQGAQCLTTTGGLGVTFNDVACKVKDKVILQRVSGMVQRGQLLAIMGPSGSGKTTLLECLAGRHQATVTGQIAYEGQTITKSMRTLTGYVKQHDIVFPSMTVAESLRFAADMRLPETVPASIKEQRVASLLKELGLQKCADTMLGGASGERVSGGELKRLSICQELIHAPPVLFLDEPTSGLDSASSYSLMRTLTRLKKKHSQTVVTTLHQPSSAIVDMFDLLLLMSEGRVVYFGPANQAVHYFESCLSLTCPLYTNPGDFYMDVCSVGHTIDAKALRRRFSVRGETTEQDSEAAGSPHSELVTLEKLFNTYESFKQQASVGPCTRSLPTSPTVNATDSFMSTTAASFTASPVVHDGDICRREGWVRDKDQLTVPAKALLSSLTPSSKSRELIPSSVSAARLAAASLSTDPEAIYMTSRWHQFSVLTQRCFIAFCRNPNYLRARVGQGIAVALILGLVFFQMSNTQDGIDTRRGCLFFMLVHAGVGSIILTLHCFQAERPVILHERDGRWYSVIPYFASKTIVEAIMQLVEPLLFTTICYWMCGFNPDLERFFMFLMLTCLINFLGNSLGLLMAAATSGFEHAAIAAGVAMISLIVFGGFLVPDSEMPMYLQWIRYALYLSYAYRIGMVTEFRGLAFTCNAEHLVGGVCPFTTGDAYLRRLGLGDVNVVSDMLILIAMAAVLRIGIYLALLLYRPRVSKV